MRRRRLNSPRTFHGGVWAKGELVWPSCGQRGAPEGGQLQAEQSVVHDLATRSRSEIHALSTRSPSPSVGFFGPFGSLEQNESLALS